MPNWVIMWHEGYKALGVSFNIVCKKESPNYPERKFGDFELVVYSL